MSGDVFQAVGFRHLALNVGTDTKGKFTPATYRRKMTDNPKFTRVRVLYSPIHNSWTSTWSSACTGWDHSNCLYN